MIRLPKLFKRKTQADDLDLGSVRGRRTAKNPSARSYQRAAEAEELALTEDPEQQRARHRLIGAAVLVLIAVIGLPRILDSKPKAVTNDIAVNIVTSLPTPSTEAAPGDKPKSDTPAESTPKVAVVEPKLEAKPEAKIEPKVETKADTKVDPKVDSKPVAPAPSKSAGLGLAAGEEVVSTAKPKAEDAPAKAATSPTPAANGSGKFVIQIGAFESDDRAKGWIAKLKDQKIPYYVLSRTNADGVKLTVLRAGPYKDKDSAEAAEKKIKAMGLNPRLVETGKQ